MRALAARGCAVLLATSAACVRVDETTRVERGPLLRTFHRPQVVEGGVRARAQVQWPTLRLELTAWDVCRDLTLDEYAEDHITERVSSAAGPALSTGITNVLASAVLFAASFAVSDQPNTNVIDQAGNYGPAPRQAVRTWSWITLGVGVPALVVGVISVLRTGEETETRRVEQLAGQQDTPCHERALSGPVVLRGGRGPVGPEKALVEGLAAWEATELTAPADEVEFFGRTAELDEGSAALLEAFGACVQLERDAGTAAEALGDGALLARAERLRACRQVRGDAVKAGLEAVEQELSRRREQGAPGAFAPGPTAGSFEEAVAAWAPKLRLASGSADLAKLDALEGLEGQAVLLEGVVAEGLTANIGVIQLGERQVYLFIPTKKAWGGDFGVGVRVEAVAVIAGTQAVGERTLPLLRAVWMRPRY